MAETNPAPVVTRFAPSPTGYLHIGGARTALFNWLYARGRGGKFLLRIEDTDRARHNEAAVKAIIDGLTWLGLDWDGEPVSQFSRAARHAEIAHALLDRGAAYRCYMTPEETAAAREKARASKSRFESPWREADHASAPKDALYAVRFKAPREGETLVRDAVQGDVRFPNSALDDLIILRSDGAPTYNLAVVVDDHDMAITHVIRGDDHLNNTPRQINMLAALGATPPVYAHLPMILGPDGAKLSKRHGAVSVLEYREQGYLPEALLNYLARLGWSHGDQEVFSLEEMTTLFDLTQVNKSAAAINPDKLNWLNQQHMLRAPPSRLAVELQGHLQRLGVQAGDLAQLEGIVTVQRERAKTLVEMAQASRFFFEAPAAYDQKAAGKHIKPETLPLLRSFRERLQALGAWTAPAIHQALEARCTEAGVGLGKLAQPVRIAVSGGAVSPPIDATLALLGKDATLARLDAALRHFGDGRK
jgi:glutamyl-tRNA synthetase